ncbi:MAG: glucan 1,4-alpha-glucosidase [Desulfobacterales bacterium]
MINTVLNTKDGPGIEPRWTSSAKSGVGTALNRNSRVWFTMSHGIFNEIYYGRIDQACTRDMGLIVTGGNDFFSEEKRDTESKVEWIAPGVPGFRLVNTCLQGRYRIEKEVLSDPKRDTVLQKTSFIPQNGKMDDYRLYVLLAPHLGNQGYHNTAWIDEFKGVTVLLAIHQENALALTCSTRFLKQSAGYVGFSDGWQDLKANRRMTWSYRRAEDGNVALTAEIDLRESKGAFVLALGFGTSPDMAAQCALDSLREGFETARTDYIAGWQKWQQSLTFPEKGESSRPELCPISAAVLRTHESKNVPGGIIASLSIPWGFARGDDELGGYHLVWPRDLVEVAGGFLALGSGEDVRRVIRYLQDKQDKDGHWEQNMWVDGARYWRGVQLDETAFPILLVSMALREKVVEKDELVSLWPMVRRAARFIVVSGPVSPQDRWEEDPGYSPFTLAVSITALLAAAEMADQNNEDKVGQYLRETADFWNDSIERWTYISDTELCRRYDVDGYYVRIAPPDVADGATLKQGFVPIKNRPPGQSSEPAAHIVSPDALSLVRFGLRAADDQRILNTVKIVDALLKVETPHGPSWHRYNDDGYGEHDNGSPFDGTGVGRTWPLLTGERAHYALAAGNTGEAIRLLHAMEAFANPSGLISEQVWDSKDVPAHELFFGKPSGSAMPLVWAHAEYIKLRRSLKDGQLFDMPDQTVKRYLKMKTMSPFTIWRFNHKCQNMPAGKTLRLEVLSDATICWSGDGWKTSRDIRARDTGLGIYTVDLDTETLRAGNSVAFTFHWIASDRWEGTDFIVKVTE